MTFRAPFILAAWLGVMAFSIAYAIEVGRPLARQTNPLNGPVHVIQER